MVVDRVEVGGPLPGSAVGLSLRRVVVLEPLQLDVLVGAPLHHLVGAGADVLLHAFGGSVLQHLRGHDDGQLGLVRQQLDSDVHRLGHHHGHYAILG